ncbi:MAG: N-acetylmuramoyl-L-alanine amidase [Anaerotignaceae bacterium]
MSKNLKLILLVCFLFVMVCHVNGRRLMANADVQSAVVVIDAGHGGWDPGKTGTTDNNEKDINLTIAKNLQVFLEASGATVIITRNGDEALGNNKREDMKERKDITEGANPDILISIHQNAFPSANAKGAQVFYYNNSKEGKILAELIQTHLKDDLDNTNTRQAKANTDYYILKQINIPTALVECGFLSNLEEEELLNSQEYQMKVAWAIYLGIVDYFNREV